MSGVGRKEGSYPKRLLELPSPTESLYLCGNEELLALLTVDIVGS